MKRAAFTLIELMIVIAILGIGLHSMYLGFPTLFKGHELRQKIVEENASLTLAYGMIRSCLKNCRRIATIAEGRIVFDNDQYIAVENFGKDLRVNGSLLQLAGRASITEVEHVSDTMFITRVNTGNGVVRVIWKAGVANE
ncbi:MAG TPA: hypothetical protein DCG57_17650 [Candidatus Riflebacteria bacterium]|nr:hypothetical protein [Candidatus Riflebacteria bacterium]